MIGVAQSTALVSGISRDGVTMGAGLARGLDHSDSARFAFLLATPMILAAGLFKLPDLLGTQGDGIRGQALVAWSAAGVTAGITVRFLVRYFKTRTLIPFAVYCLVFGLAMVIYTRPSLRRRGDPAAAASYARRRSQRAGWRSAERARRIPGCGGRCTIIDARCPCREPRRRCSRPAARPGRRSACCARSARAWSNAHAWRRCVLVPLFIGVVLVYDNRFSLLGTPGPHGQARRRSKNRSKRRCAW